MGRMREAGTGVTERSADSTSRSFEEFFRDEHARLLRALFLVTGNEGEAEELMQEAFLRVWEQWDRVGRLDTPRDDEFERLVRLRRRRQQTRRIQAGVVGLVVAAAGAVGALEAFHQPGSSPVVVGTAPSAEFHALWPEQALADAQH